MEKYDLDILIHAAQAWLQVVEQMKKEIDEGEWDHLDDLYRIREECVARYQSTVEHIDFGGYSASLLEPLNSLLKAIQEIENQLLVVLDEYKGHLVESIKSIQMEGSLQQRYSLDGA